MENFLSNNVPFNDTNDVLTFIQNIKDETPKYDILNYLDDPIGKEDLVKYLVSHAKEGHSINSEIVSQYVSALSPELVNRIYYKNQILELIKNNSWFLRRLAELIQYKYTDKPEEAMKEPLNEFKDLILDFCFYDYLFEDRYKRSMKDFRKSIITIDTDSNFINLNKYIETVNNEFQLDKNNKDQQLTVMNIFVDTVTESLKKTFWTTTTNLGLIDSAKPLINMKSEFNYQRILLTRNKKS